MGLIGLVATYGYFIIFLGGLFEGEIFLILGGLAAHEAFLSLPLVLLFASLGALIGDTTCFLLGRYFGEAMLKRWPSLQKYRDLSQDLVNRNVEMIVVLLRFMYGFRNFVFFSLGMSEIKASKFLLYNSFAVIIWVALIGSVGYLFGDVLQVLIGNIKAFEFRIIAAVGLFIFILVLGFGSFKLALKRFFQ